MNSATASVLWRIRGLHTHFPAPLVTPIQRATERAFSRSPTALALLYDTEKGPCIAQVAGRKRHFYTDHYRDLLGSLRSQPMTMLEIGIFKGASLRLWRRYFPKAKIIGIDLDPPDLDLPGVEMYAGDQSDPAFLESVIERHGPFGLVIDDGSHIGRHIHASFEALFPAVRPDGWYVIEDLATAYSNSYEGGPIGTPGTAVDLVKGLVDRTQPESDMHEVSELHLFEGIVFIRKAGGASGAES